MMTAKQKTGVKVIAALAACNSVIYLIWLYSKWYEADSSVYHFMGHDPVYYLMKNMIFIALAAVLFFIPWEYALAWQRLIWFVDEDGYINKRQETFAVWTVCFALTSWISFSIGYLHMFFYYRGLITFLGLMIVALGTSHIITMCQNRYLANAAALVLVSVVVLGIYGGSHSFIFAALCFLSFVFGIGMWNYFSDMSIRNTAKHLGCIFLESATLAMIGILLTGRGSKIVQWIQDMIVGTGGEFDARYDDWVVHPFSEVLINGDTEFFFCVVVLLVVEWGVLNYSMGYLRRTAKSISYVASAIYAFFTVFVIYSFGADFGVFPSFPFSVVGYSVPWLGIAVLGKCFFFRSMDEVYDEMVLDMDDDEDWDEDLEESNQERMDSLTDDLKNVLNDKLKK